MKFKGIIASLALLAALIWPPTSAEAGDNPALARIGVGGFDVSDTGTTWEVDANYRFGTSYWYFYPQLGALASGKGDTYAYAGILLDFNLSQNWHTNISTAVGNYSKGGADGKDLGGPLNFRTGIELQYAFQDESRLGLAVYHISNAGIYKDNPGEETVLLTVALPVDFFGN